MSSERDRILELALESLQRRRQEIEAEIADVTAQMKKRVTVRKAAPVVIAKKKARFSKEERLRRSKRMKLYWDKWRKEKKAQG